MGSYEVYIRSDKVSVSVKSEEDDPDFALSSFSEVLIKALEVMSGSIGCESRLGVCAHAIQTFTDIGQPGSSEEWDLRLAAIDYLNFERGEWEEIQEMLNNAKSGKNTPATAPREAAKAD